jgi:uncharacterized protein (TIGR03435 family)
MRSTSAPYVVVTLLVVSLFVATATSAQSPASVRPPTAFEVASVKPSEPGAQGGGIARPVNGLMRASGVTLRQLVRYAYDLEPLQRRDPESVGGPEWIDRDRFDIVARGPADLSFPDSRLMMRSLLAERFALQTHTETRELPVYFLVMARNDGRLGSGLRRSEVDCTAYSAALTATGRGAIAKQVGPQCGLSSGGAPAVAATLGITNTLPRGAQMARGTATMAELLTVITRSPEIDRKIVDRSGLTGTFDIDLNWVPARNGALVAEPTDVLTIFTAIDEQLGLKLQPARASIDVVVIAGAQRPTPN